MPITLTSCGVHKRRNCFPINFFRFRLKRTSRSSSFPLFLFSSFPLFLFSSFPLFLFSSFPLFLFSSFPLFLFSSPQAIVNNQIWRPMIDSLITKRLLSMLCIDEVHMFVQFGLTFRQEFALLQSVLFKKLRVKASPSAELSRFHTAVPVLFMTATCNQSMVAQNEKLSGLRFDRSSNIFWPSADAMHHQNVCLRVAYSTYPLSSFKKLVGPALETSRLRKYIWYANNRDIIERHTKMLGSWIDQQGFKSDVVSVTGAQMKEQKFHHIKLASSRD
jgi:superfamily II DNA helicase RecQ